jgi:hypothetical protein
MKYKSRNFHWENTWTKIIINVHSFNVKLCKTLIEKTWEKSSKETMSLPPFCVSRKRFESVTNPS